MKETQFTYILNAIKKDFTRRKAKNSQYSLRSYANFLEIDASNLSKIINQKRNLSRVQALNIAQKLRIDSSRVHKALSSKKFENLSLDKFEYVSQWYHDAILELTRIDEFVPSIEWIARKIGITKSECKKGIQRLQDLNLLEITEDGQWKDRSGDNILVTDDLTSTAQKMYQKTILSHAIEAIDNVPKTQRNNSSVTLAMSSKQLENAKKEIMRFQKKICQILEDSDDIKDDVYHLSVSLFPINSKQRGKK